jgi:DNA-binding transcriptional ArsR family regulator
VNVEGGEDLGVARIASAIGERARARILYCLMDGRARTATELAAIAEVSPSTASVHMNRLRAEGLVVVQVACKHRYYSLEGPRVAKALEALSVLAGGARPGFVPSTPTGLRAARTCYDHLAGRLGVALFDRLKALRWLGSRSPKKERAHELTPEGPKALGAIGVDIEAARAARRRFAYSCLDWSERRPHLGGALGAALLKLTLDRKWVSQDLDSRALEITSLGRRELLSRFGLQS